MRTIGLIGGMSWESRRCPYYQHLNRLTAERLGPLHSARIVLYSVDFHEIETMQRTARWDDAGVLLAAMQRARWKRRVRTSSCCARTRCTRSRGAVAAAVDIRCLHIVDPTGRSHPCA